MRRQPKWIALLLCAVMTLAVSAALGEIIPVTLSDEGCSSEADTVICDETGVTITAPGEYMLSGSLKDGQVKVDCKEKGKVTLHLDGVTIHHEKGAAILILSASPRLRIALTAGTENLLSNGENLEFTDGDEPNGVIFSKSDLTLEGSGKLTVTAGSMDGIVSKDDLRIEGGEITVTAPRHGIRGKDCVEIESGTISVKAGKDGIRSNNDKDPELGYIAITGGDIRIVCGDDPLDFVTGLSITGGTLNSTVQAN